MKAGNCNPRVTEGFYRSETKSAKSLALCLSLVAAPFELQKTPQSLCEFDLLTSQRLMKPPPQAACLISLPAEQRIWSAEVSMRI